MNQWICICIYIYVYAYPYSYEYTKTHISHISHISHIRCIWLLVSSIYLPRWPPDVKFSDLTCDDAVDVKVTLLQGDVGSHRHWDQAAHGPVGNVFDGTITTKSILMNLSSLARSFSRDSLISELRRPAVAQSAWQDPISEPSHRLDDSHPVRVESPNDHTGKTSDAQKSSPTVQCCWRCSMRWPDLRRRHRQARPWEDDIWIRLVGGWATPLKNMKVNWDD